MKKLSFGAGNMGGKSADMGGKPMPKQAKVGKVMREFKAGELKSSSGKKVTNPKQAIAIGLSEAGLSRKAKGGDVKESKAMMKKEVSFMKKKGAPKSMIKHEEAEMKYSKGGGVAPSKMGAVKTAAPSRDGVAVKGKTKGKNVVMPGGKGMKAGGMTKMRKGGAC
jgi:hypothetical protein